MKYPILSTIALCAFTGNLYAQEMTTISFVVDHQNYQYIDGCTPNTNVSFYSSHLGGKKLRNFIANSNGSVIYHGTPAAFALNTKLPTATGITGTGKVAFFKEPLFDFKNFEVVNEGNSVLITWNATATDEQITFELMKSSNGINYIPVCTTNATAIHGTSKYVLNDNLETTIGWYKIVIKYKNVIVYTTAARQVIAQNTIQLYPTLAQSSINVVIGDNQKGQTYSIYSAEGKNIASGILPENKNVIDIEMLNSGNYFFSIGSEKKWVRFIKL